MLSGVSVLVMVVQLNHLTDKQLHCAGLLLLWPGTIRCTCVIVIVGQFYCLSTSQKFYARFEPRLSTTNNDIMEHNEARVTMQTPTTHRHTECLATFPSLVVLPVLPVLPVLARVAGVSMVSAGWSLGSRCHYGHCGHMERRHTPHYYTPPPPPPPAQKSNIQWVVAGAGERRLAAAFSEECLRHHWHRHQPGVPRLGKNSKYNHYRHAHYKIYTSSIYSPVGVPNDFRYYCVD